MLVQLEQEGVQRGAVSAEDFLDQSTYAVAADEYLKIMQAELEGHVAFLHRLKRQVIRDSGVYLIL